MFSYSGTSNAHIWVGIVSEHDQAIFTILTNEKNKTYIVRESGEE